MALIGGGPFKNLGHWHFWKAAFALVIIITGLWAWHHFKIQHDVRTEEIAKQQFEAQRKLRK